MAKKSIDDYIGLKIEEVLPYHDGVTVILSNGEEVDLGLDPDELKMPKHPKEIRDIYRLQDKLIRKHPEKPLEEMEELKSAMDNLIGKEFTFNKNPCQVVRVEDYCGKVKIAYRGQTKVVDIFSLR
jgi:hypothetical protein